MKTDLVEIFQSIRAILQPYTTKGFVSKTNSENLYDLWSDKKLDTEANNNELQSFACISIKKSHVEFCIAKGLGDQHCTNFDQLDEKTLDEINITILKAYTNHKQKGWI